MNTIIAKELRILFLSPLAWTILAVINFILAWLFMVNVDRFILMQSQLASYEGAPGVTAIVVMPLFSVLAVLLLLVTPLLTMRMISEEHRNQTIKLLLASPINSAQIVVGKYLSILIFIVIILLFLTLMALSLNLGTQLDYGLLMSGLLGAFLLLASFTAIGLYLSSLTKQPTIAAIGTFGILFILWVINWAEQLSNTENETLHQIFSWLSIIKHQESFMSGLILSTDIIYYLSICGFFLLLAIRTLENQRLQP